MQGIYMDIWVFASICAKHMKDTFESENVYYRRQVQVGEIKIVWEFPG